jgi:hypothetical protein
MAPKHDEPLDKPDDGWRVRSVADMASTREFNGAACDATSPDRSISAS